ncbi:PQQ-binding-like beta-propeller repeat protein [Micromonospora peucetia]|uniref:Outer membrane protein assembly factor BamB, contains PQQ-like beta-propeller repeat n=1 Tax=Micromonospora peucetia TaxID=47871 RepID=A0A1C6VFD8_9ACTN|nr:PQQ-binding-like beta-propeller repeat protein [Micromonospora peucetia]SCL65061.1 Outer membrane protein assembly factor BamB, contains PQQ-like beta-propeller repeat [Micromonospora peucetia]
MPSLPAPEPARLPLDRRRLLGLGVGAVAAAATGAVTGGAPAVAGPPGHGGPWSAGFALLGDTQIDVDLPERTEGVRWAYEQIAARNPSIVCHVGDIVEHGSVAEYDTYFGTIPVALRPKIRHVPGNHDWRWDSTAGERYGKLFGPSRYSFDFDGLHFVALDPSHLLQEPGGFGESGIRWLTRDLDRVAPGVPIILLCHFPFGGDNYYVSDQERLLELLDRYNVRAVFAGHVHAEQVQRFNGVTQLAVDDTRGSAIYYWVQRTAGPDGQVLKVTAVQRGADGSAESRSVLDIPVSGPRTAIAQRPQAVSLDPAGAALAVSVRLAPHVRAANVKAQLYPQHTYGLKDAGQWRNLASDGAGRRFSGGLDLTSLPPGEHRMTVRVTDADGAWYEQTRTFDLPDTARRLRWSEQLGAPVQAGLAVRDDLLVAATTDGTVIGARPTRRGLSRRWRERIGPVHGRPAFAPDGRTVYVPSDDHRLYALDPATGRRRFTHDAGAPVLGSPLVTTVDGRSVVVLSAGATRQVIDARTGGTVWNVAGKGMFAGRAASDGTRVYAGAGDGNVYAHDARTGAVLWSFSTTTRATVYSRLIYGPWADNLEVLPNGLVLVSTVTSAFALDPATGELRWSVAGSYIYAPKLLLDNGDVVMFDDGGRTASRVDPATGQARWTTGLGARPVSTGAAIHDGVAWIPTTTGLVVAVDLTTGSVRTRLQLTTSAYCYSPPVVIGDMLMVGDQDGFLHGIAVN